MKFNVHIKNIGKLTDAKLEFGQFTVLAGPNNTGKSFVSKLVYSFFNAMNANHADVYLKNLLLSVTETRMFERMSMLDARMRVFDRDEFNSEEVSSIVATIAKIEEAFKGSTTDNVEKFSEIIGGAVDNIKSVRNAVDSIREPSHNLGRMLGIPRNRAERYGEELEELAEQLSELQKTLEVASAQAFLDSGLGYKISDNLIQNFQVSRLENLLGNKDKVGTVTVGEFGKFEISNGAINLMEGRANSMGLQNYSGMLYLESPAYWRLKHVLEEFRSERRHFAIRRNRITGIPGYFYDLTSALRYEYTGEMDFPDIHQHLTGKDVMGGKIMLSDEGNLLFNENGRSFALPITALGVANLGMLALLIERKVLDKDTFLFIDEPEAHLHPYWQVVMAEALFALAKNGVHVVIATHSVDILKFIESEVGKNPESEELIALNHFSRNGIFGGGECNFNAKLDTIQSELTKPFAKLYWGEQ